MTRDILYNPFAHRVDFTDMELTQIHELAVKRQAIKDKNLSLVNDRRVSDYDNILMHNIGLLGECAVSKILRVPVDEQAYLAGDHAQDFNIFGIKVEVKTQQGYLYFDRMQAFQADVAVLCVYDKRDLTHVIVQGWIPRKLFIDRHFIDNFGRGDRPCMQPVDLFPIRTLNTYCLMLRDNRLMIRQMLEIMSRINDLNGMASEIKQTLENREDTVFLEREFA